MILYMLENQILLSRLVHSGQVNKETRALVEPRRQPWWKMGWSPDSIVSRLMMIDILRKPVAFG